MFPPPARIKGRVAALQWFVDRAGARLAGNGAGSHDAADLDALDAALQRLAELARARFAADAPALQSLFSALERLRAGAPAGTPGAAAAGAACRWRRSSRRLATPDVTASRAAAADAAPRPTRPPPSPAEESSAAQHARLIEAVSAWLEPISADERAGKDARYDPLHEEVRAMIKQLDSPIGGAIEWKKLVSRTETLLKQRSKDLLIAAYAAYGMYQQTGLSGLADGIALVAGPAGTLLGRPLPRHEAQPQSARGRVDLVAAAPVGVGERAVGPTDAAVVARLAEAARWFADEVATRFDYDHRPALRPFLEQIERLELAVQAPAAATPQPDGRAPRVPARAVAAPATGSARERAADHRRGSTTTSPRRAALRTATRSRATWRRCAAR